MKTSVALVFALMALKSFAVQTPPVLDATIIDGKMVVEFEYEKAVRPALIPIIKYPVKHTWLKVIECRHDKTAKIDVTVRVKDQNIEVETIPMSTKKLTFPLNKLCKGKPLKSILINNTNLTL